MLPVLLIVPFNDKSVLFFWLMVPSIVTPVSVAELPVKISMEPLPVVSSKPLWISALPARVTVELLAARIMPPSLFTTVSPVIRRLPPLRARILP